MNLNSKLFDRIRTRSKAEAEVKPQVPECQWDGCEKPGTHKAPVGRMKEGEYFQFCVDHVRQYNKGFNYFSGLTDNEIARYQREAVTGHRPTWKAGVNAAAKETLDPTKARWGRSAPRGNRTRDAHDIFGEARSRYTPATKKAKPLEAKALDTLGLPETATKEEVKVRYKELLKQHHPDTNGGDRSTEDRLQAVIQAYKMLKQSGLG